MTLSPGVPGTLLQVGIYTKTRFMLLNAFGQQQEMTEWLEAVAAHRWEETD